MALTFLIVKLTVVVALLIIFLRRPTLTWGIGLVSVTTAVLLDTFLGTFGREEMAAQLGFFFYVVAGALFAGAAAWTWGLLRPLLNDANTSATPASATGETAVTGKTAVSPTNHPANSNDAFDHQMIYDDIRNRFGREDVLDLMFDLDINENDVAALNQSMGQLIRNVVDTAEARGQTAALALGVERILTPPPPENLPRLAKLTADSPRPVLRQYLLAHYTLADLQAIATTLSLDWEQLGGTSKKGKVRELLLYLRRRNRLDELVTHLRQQSVDAT